MGLWGSFMWATSIMVHFSKSIASQLGGLPLMGFRSKKRSKKRGMQQRRRHLADTGSTPSAALSPCSTSVGRTQPLAAAVARAEASWLLRDLQHALNMRDEAAMSRVGSMLMAGYGTKQDPEEAALWMREAWAVQNFYELETVGSSPDTPRASCSKPPSAAVAASSVHRNTSVTNGLHCQRQQEGGQLKHTRPSASSQGATSQGAGQCGTFERGSSHPPCDFQHAGQCGSIDRSSSHPPKSECSSGGPRDCNPPSASLSAHRPLPMVHHRDAHEQQGGATETNGGTDAGQQGGSTVTYGGVLGEVSVSGEGSARLEELGSSEPSTDDFSTDEEWAGISAYSLQGSLGSLARGLPAGQLLGAGAFVRCAFKATQGGRGSGRGDEQRGLSKSERPQQFEVGALASKNCCDEEEREVDTSGGHSGDQRVVCRMFAAEWPRVCSYEAPMRGSRRRVSL